MHPDILPSKLKSMIPARRHDVFADFQHQMNRMLRDFFDDEPSQLSSLEAARGTDSFIPRLEAQESDDKISLSIELPGLSDSDIDIVVEKDFLTIKGEKKEETETKKKGRYFSERRYGAFERTVRLPSSVEKDKISATFNRGVLTVDVPKSAEAKKEVKKIPIKH
jgi:HSP20 family protein